MQDRTKIIDIRGQRYQLSRFDPEVGSFILSKILKTAFDRIIELSSSPANEEKAPPARKPDPETTIRVFANTAFGSMDFETHKFIQRKCLTLVARIEQAKGDDPNDYAMPIVTPSGQWAAKDIEADLPLIRELVTEVLVFNLAPFFTAEGLKTAMGAGAERSA